MSALGPNVKILSGVSGRFQLEGVDDMQATLQVTMSLGMWKTVQDALAKEDKYGVWQLKSMIRDLIASASAAAYARIEKDAKVDA